LRDEGSRAPVRYASGGGKKGGGIGGGEAWLGDGREEEFPMGKGSKEGIVSVVDTHMKGRRKI